MDNLLLNLSEQMNFKEALSYFSAELFYLAGVILNIILFFFCTNKLNTKRISDFLTGGIFLINSVILFGIYAENVNLFGSFSSFILDNSIVFDEKNILIKILINIFALFYMFVVYKFTRKSKFKVPLINAILLAVMGCAGLAVQFEDFILSYLFLEFLVVLIYKYASNMRIKKLDIYNFDFLLLSTCATILFFVFYLMTFFAKENIQLSIIQVCITCAFLLKIGIFPIYNYLTNRRLKTNIPYSILLYSFLCFIGVIVFSKMIQSFNLIDEVYQISVASVIILALIGYALMAFKTKNLVKFIANISYCFNAFCLLNILFMGSFELSIRLSSMVMFATLALYSLLCILKLNLNPSKFNIGILKGVFINNRGFSLIFSILLLIISFVIPSGIMKCELNILENIYNYDKFGIFALVLIILANTALLFNSLRIIVNCYMYEKNAVVKKFTKRTTLNYVVLFVISLFLIINLFL